MVLLKTTFSLISLILPAFAVPTAQPDLKTLTNGERFALGIRSVKKPVRNFDPTRTEKVKRATGSGVAVPAGTSTTFGGQTYVNKGLVAFGIIAADAKDSYGETIGGIGSAIDFEIGSFARSGTSNVYTGTLIVQPDRGHNTVSTIDYNTRQHRIALQFTPYYDTATQTFAQGSSTATLTYQDTLLYNAFGNPTSGLDALGVLAATSSHPAEPIPSASYPHLSTDPEGLIKNADGTFWVSDEYGPYIWKFDASGNLLSTIAPPKAILPYIGGALNFTSATTPDTGRSDNQGFESLSVSGDGTILWAMLQSGCVQDGGDSNRYSRLLGWDITGSSPVLLYHYVVNLPVTNGKSKTIAVSEFKWLSSSAGVTTFVILSRDGKGMGDTDPDSKHKDFLLINTQGASNLVGTTYSDDVTPVAPSGTLLSSITAIQTTEFISIIDSTQLARFGLQNGGNFDQTLIDGKFESIALASCHDNLYPNDYFLFSLSDNDFITSNGYADGAAYSDPYGKEVNTQLLIWRVTLPSNPNTLAG